MKQNYCIKIPTLKSRLVFNIATSIIFMIVCNISYGNNTYMPPSNDDPYSATMLTSNTSCSVVSSTTLTATDTTNPIAINTLLGYLHNLEQTETGSTKMPLQQKWHQQLAMQ